MNNEGNETEVVDEDIPLRLSDDPVVELKVGDSVFATKESTLHRARSRYFFRLLGGRENDEESTIFCSDCDNWGRLVIDRNPDDFRLVLTYLQGGLNIKTLTDEQVGILLREAHFFGIDSLIEELSYRGYNPTCLVKQDNDIRYSAHLWRGRLHIENPEESHVAKADKDNLEDLFRDGKRQYTCAVDFNVFSDSRWECRSATYGYLFEGFAGQFRAAHGSKYLSAPSNVDEFRKKLEEFGGCYLRNLPMKNVVIAGGAVLRILDTTASPDDQSDIDLFVVASSEKEALETFENLLEHFRREHMKVEPGQRGMLASRTGQAVTFSFGYPLRPIQLILRIHTCISDVLLGFDIDSCQVAYDGKTVYATKSALRAIETGMNIVDPERATTKYEERLIKYVFRGYMVAVPGLDFSRIQKKYLGNHFFASKHGELHELIFGTVRKGGDAKPNIEISFGERVFGLAKLIVLSRCYCFVNVNNGTPVASDDSDTEASLASYLEMGLGWGTQPVLGPNYLGPNYLMSYRRIIDKMGTMSSAFSFCGNFPAEKPPDCLLICPSCYMGVQTDSSGGGPLLPFSSEYGTAESLHERLAKITRHHKRQGRTLWLVYDLVRDLGSGFKIEIPHVRDARSQEPATVFSEQTIPRYIVFAPSWKKVKNTWSVTREFDWNGHVYE